MKAYLDIVRNILDNGKLKINRTGVDAVTIPFVHFEHDMQEGFPLLTSKKMAFKSTCVELEGFLKGVTSKKWFQDRGCHFWDYWCSPALVPQYIDDDGKYVSRNDSDYCTQDTIDLYLTIGMWREISTNEARKFMMECDDLGPLGYSWQWRRFGESCNENDNGVLQGTDQLEVIIKRLKENPNDRRMVCSAWNPNQLVDMALPPCHFAWFVTVIEDTLNLCWIQRSVDTMIGLPHNIASYALLLKLLANYAGLAEGKLSGFLCDTHIYVNHLEKAAVQIHRPTHKLPSVVLNRPASEMFIFKHRKADDGPRLFVEFDAKTDVKLVDYVHEDKLDFEIAV